MTSAVAVDVLGVGLLGPGLADWAQGQALLAHPEAWQPSATVVSAPARLPANERRRAEPTVRASILVADQACAEAAIDPATLATVFTSSSGEPGICHALCEALARPDPMISPTRFTNSVHNAAAGYWHIATRSMQASTSLAAFDASFAAGWLEAVSQCRHSAQPVLLVACDVPYPEPLHRVRALADVFAVAFVIAPPGAERRGRRVQMRLPDDAWLTITRCTMAALEALRSAVPAARALPLLQALARGEQGAVLIESLPGMALELELQ